MLATSLIGSARQLFAIGKSKPTGSYRSRRGLHQRRVIRFAKGTLFQRLQSNFV
jgi:hypothetical protein